MGVVRTEIPDLKSKVRGFYQCIGNGLFTQITEITLSGFKGTVFYNKGNASQSYPPNYDKMGFFNGCQGQARMGRHLKWPLVECDSGGIPLTEVVESDPAAKASSSIWIV